MMPFKKQKCGNIHVLNEIQTMQSYELSKISLTRKTNILHTWTAVPNSKLFIHVHQHIQSENKRSVDHIAHLRNIS